MKPIKLSSLLITLTVLLGLIWQVGQAQTQPDVQLDSVNIQLLPEYTHPSVLVIYEIELDETLSLPQELMFEVPADAQVLNLINFTPENRPFELVFQESQIGNWKDLQFTARYHRIRIELQDPNLVRQETERSYDFQWLSIYPVSSLSINIRQPLGASEITSQPPLQKLEDQPEEVANYLGNFNNIPAGELFTLTLSYTKDPTDSAIPALPVQPAVSIDGPAPGRTPTPVNVILWLLVASVAIIIIVLIYYLWYRSTFTTSDEHVIQGVGILNPEKQPYFCHECGMRSNPGDSYCSNCGTELRKPTPFEGPLRK